MKDSRRGGTKVLSVVDVILRSNGRDEVICARSYYDWACLAATEHSNGWDDVIRACCYCDICVKINMVLLPSQKEMPTNYSPPDHPATCSSVLLSKRMRTSRNALTLSDIFSGSYCCGFISLRRNLSDIFMGSYCCHVVGL
jgi:hypothetical protein